LTFGADKGKKFTHNCMKGQKISVFIYFGSSNRNIFKPLLDIGLKIWFFNNYG
jgi:hypothetical protein